MNGYNGIMDLDLTNIDPKFYKELLDLHRIDIKEYKLDQAKRKAKDRYENSVGRAMKNIEYNNMLRAKRLQKNEDEKNKIKTINRQGNCPTS